MDTIAGQVVSRFWVGGVIDLDCSDRSLATLHY